MRILLVAATVFEVAGFIAFSKNQTRHRFKVLVTGPGMIKTTWAITDLLGDKDESFDLAINAGIAGSYDPELVKGTVVEVVQDVFADFGAEDGSTFLEASTIGLSAPDEFPFRSGRLNSTHSFQSALMNYPHVKGISVNTVSGHNTTIQRRLSLFGAQTESMEGAAFFYCCLQKDVPCLQLRAISNPVEKRNKENWNIPLAVSNLNTELIKIASLLPAVSE